MLFSRLASRQSNRFNWHYLKTKHISCQKVKWSIFICGKSEESVLMNQSFCFSSVILDQESNGYKIQSQKMLLVVRQPFFPENAARDMCALMEVPGGQSKIMQLLGERNSRAWPVQRLPKDIKGVFSPSCKIVVPDDLALCSVNLQWVGQSLNFSLYFFLPCVCFAFCSKLYCLMSFQSVFKASKLMAPTQAQLHLTQNFTLNPIYW